MNMNCHEARELLSAYHDQELSADLEAQVADHLLECESCAAERESFASLSNLIGSLEIEVPTDSMWQEVEPHLSGSPQVQPASRPRSNSLSFKRLLALAATVLVAVGILWAMNHSGHDHGNHETFTVQFGEYLDEFRRDPDAAQKKLLAMYPHRSVNLDQMIQEVGYRPAVAKGLPDGYRAEATHVMDMPCCKCIQTVCKRPDGTSLAVFEHDDDDAQLWFGNRAEVNANCKGKQCCLVEINDQLAVTWKQGERYITLIGVQDISEVQQFVAAIDGQHATAEDRPAKAT